MSPELEALVKTVAYEIAMNGGNMSGTEAYAAALAAICAVAEATREASEKMTDAGGHAHYRKRVDAGSPWPTEQVDDGGGPMGYAWRAMHAASTLGEALRDAR